MTQIVRFILKVCSKLEKMVQIFWLKKCLIWISRDFWLPTFFISFDHLCFSVILKILTLSQKSKVIHKTWQLKPLILRQMISWISLTKLLLKIRLNVVTILINNLSHSGYLTGLVGELPDFSMRTWKINAEIFLITWSHCESRFFVNCMYAILYSLYNFNLWKRRQNLNILFNLANWLPLVLLSENSRVRIEVESLLHSLSNRNVQIWIFTNICLHLHRK